MEITNRTTTTRGRRTCADILDNLSDDSRMALERWRRLADLDSTYLGGRGRTPEQMRVAARAWDELPPAAQDAYFAVLCAVVSELADVIRAVGVPKIEMPIDAVEALLGLDHPALRVLPAYSIADAYEEAIVEAMNQIDG